ncbi:hypothetical protein [Shimia thalassica]|uniref:hypothetical protein n=1 Tax=Shimia thalassica TaxID=1715693 RepID=UPI0026E41C8A|nr:hypothetical protein [Shimia thalassica]MDO6483090.1 hypothetical protein [Shimia thalassica]
MDQSSSVTADGVVGGLEIFREILNAYGGAVDGLGIFKPSTGEVVSSEASDIACWFIDTDYSGESFFVRQAYFPGADVPYKALWTTLKGEIDEEAWDSPQRTVSRPFARPRSGRIAVKVINHLGDEVMNLPNLNLLGLVGRTT